MIKLEVLIVKETLKFSEGKLTISLLPYVRNHNGGEIAAN